MKINKNLLVLLTAGMLCSTSSVYTDEQFPTPHSDCNVASIMSSARKDGNVLKGAYSFDCLLKIDQAGYINSEDGITVDNPWTGTPYTSEEIRQVALEETEYREELSRQGYDLRPWTQEEVNAFITSTNAEIEEKLREENQLPSETEKTTEKVPESLSQYVDKKILPKTSDKGLSLNLVATGLALLTEVAVKWKKKINLLF